MSPSSAPASGSGGCANATVTGDIRSALVIADNRPAATERPGETYYGICGLDSFAVASFEPATTATTQQTIDFQDHGSYPEFFTKIAAASWHLVGSAYGPPGPADCIGFTQAPSTLRLLWQNCTTGGVPRTASTASASSTTGVSGDQACATYAAQTFVQLVSAEGDAAGRSSATAHPATVHCGGPDDHHFIIGTATETISIPTAAVVEVLSGTSDIAVDGKQLAASVASSGPGIFQITGPLSGATGVIQQYRP